MQQIHEFGITLSEYHKRGKENEFPEVTSCPICHAQKPLEKHGFYTRNALLLKKDYRIPIRRYCCSSCQRTVSILPSFLLPYYQYSLSVIMDCLKQILAVKKKHVRFYRQLAELYRNRYLRNIPGILSFFRDTCSETLIFCGDTHKKAIKLLEMIDSSPEETFAKRYFNHFRTSFMAI